MNTGSLVTAILAMLATAASTLVMLVFGAASMANASPESLHRTEAWMTGFSVAAVVGILGGVWLLWTRRPAPAAIVSVMPAAAMLFVFIWKIVSP